jgi:hypothetical protein
MRLVDVLHALTRRAQARPPEDIVHASMPIYVRNEHGHLVTVEVAPQTTVRWATARALIALDDPRDAAQCALVFHGNPLTPDRSLDASGVRHGDSLNLVSRNVVAPRHHRDPRRPDTPSH